jgi:hypothetical protein
MANPGAAPGARSALASRAYYRPSRAALQHADVVRDRFVLPAQCVIIILQRRRRSHRPILILSR